MCCVNSPPPGELSPLFVQPELTEDISAYAALLVGTVAANPNNCNHSKYCFLVLCSHFIYQLNSKNKGNYVQYMRFLKYYILQRRNAVMVIII